MKTCANCDLLYELLKRVHCNYAYWLVTELFMILHDGKDYCE